MAAKPGRHLLDSIDAVVVAYNDRSTRSHRSEQLIQRLRRELPTKRISVVGIGSDDTAANRRKLLDRLKRTAAPGRTLLIAGGGDGTAHFVAAALLHADTPAEYRKTPITPWPLGNGNDFFNSVHGPSVARDPLQALLSPQLHAIHVHPLEWHITGKEGTDTRRFSLCYGTIGASGSATEYINQPAHRERRKQTSSLVRRLLLDIRQGARALWFPKRFMVHERGRAFRATELQFNNGPIMTMRARYPELLSERGMFVTSSRSRHPLAIVFDAMRLGFGTPPGAHHTGTLHFSLKSDDPIHAQSDGEPFRLPTQVRFSIGPSNLKLTVWATKKA
jgi:diacylglycerol kinase family enzyme